jgi:hypothetical protein
MVPAALGMSFEVIVLQERAAVVVDVLWLSGAPRVFAPAVAAKEHRTLGLIETDALFPLRMPRPEMVSPRLPAFHSLA